jgi:hypothetical protein
VRRCSLRERGRGVGFEVVELDEARVVVPAQKAPRALFEPAARDEAVVPPAAEQTRPPVRPVQTAEAPRLIHAFQLARPLLVERRRRADFKGQSGEEREQAARVEVVVVELGLDYLAGVEAQPAAPLPLGHE